MSKRQKLNELKLKGKKRSHTAKAIEHDIVSKSITPDVKIEKKNKMKDIDIENLVKNAPVSSTIINKPNAGSKRAKLQEMKSKQTKRKNRLKEVTKTEPSFPIPPPTPVPVKTPTPTQPTSSTPIVPPAPTQTISTTSTTTTKKGRGADKNTKKGKIASKKEQLKKNKERREQLKREHAEQIHNDMLTKYGINTNDIEIDKDIFEKISMAILKEFDQNKSYKKDEIMAKLQYRCDMINLGGAIQVDTITTKDPKGLYLFVLQKIMKDIDTALLADDTIILKDVRIMQDNDFKKDHTKIDNTLFIMSVRLDVGYNPKEHPDETTTLLYSGRDRCKKQRKLSPEEMKNGYIPDAVKPTLVKSDFEKELDSMFTQSLADEKNSSGTKVALFSL